MKNSLIAAALIVSAASASAQLYAGGTYGSTAVNADCMGAAGCERSSTGFKVYGGFKAIPALGAEVGYMRFGTVKPGVLLSDGTSVAVAAKASAGTVAAVGRYTFAPDFTGVVKLGVARVTTKLSQPDVGVSLSESRSKPYYAFGAEFGIAKNIKGVFSADFTKAEIQGETSSLRLVGVGLQAEF